MDQFFAPNDPQDITSLLKDLQLASDIQKQLIEPLPQVHGLDFEVSLLPAESIGGDCYDFLQVSPERALMYVGDVTGHGIPAGVVMAMVNSLFYTLSHFCQSPKDILIQGNQLLKNKIRQNTFITAVMCNWDVAREQFSYTSAGHEQIIHYSAKYNDIRMCSSGGIALGMVSDISEVIEERTVDLDAGDVLVLYSDGITEALSSSGEMLGIDRFKNTIFKNAKLQSATEIHYNILHDVLNFMEGETQHDDMTLMVIKRN
jgi:serine phosphatase RsbU (regulator of sigma subunit)